VKNLLKENQGAYEIELKVKNINTKTIGIQLYNSKGEEVAFVYHLDTKQFSMDRTKSGQTSFNPNFAAVTSAPIESQGSYTLRLLVDKCSIEAFDGEGKFAMTNLVFPTEPYNQVKFYSEGGSFQVESFHVYSLIKK
jgi:fructan beta-fructosidase